jgi:diamine N-acetyltransferase
MVSRDAAVTLREVTADTVNAILALAVAEAQTRYVATNARSIAQAYFHPEAWFRSIYADEEPVGFLMLHDESLLPTPRRLGHYFLWRFMIDARYQRLGFGRRALDLLVRHVRSRPHARRLLTSYVPGPGGPERFYLEYGFAPTGRIDEDGEIELALQL